MEKTTLGPQPLLYPMPALLIGATVNGKVNFMTAAWSGMACRKPPALSVAIHTERHTLSGIRENRTFSVNVPSASQAEIVDYCGIYSGRRVDKADLFNCFFGQLKTAPLIRECPLNLECRVVHLLELGTHTLVVGEIVESHCNADCLTEGQPDPTKIDPLVYSTGIGQYQRLGAIIGKAFHIGKK